MTDLEFLASNTFTVGLSTGETVSITADDFVLEKGVATFIDDETGVEVAIVFNPTYIGLPNHIHY